MAEEKEKVTYRCRDCYRALRVRESNKGRRSEIKCTDTDTWLSPFAEICPKFELRGTDRGIGRVLLSKLEEKKTD